MLLAKGSGGQIARLQMPPIAAQGHGKNPRKMAAKQTEAEMVEKSEEKQQQARREREAAQGPRDGGQDTCRGKAVQLR
jgi:hypothetical protein